MLAEASVMGTGTRRTSDEPGVPSQHSTSPARRLALDPRPVRCANTTDAGTRKKLLGSSLSKSHAVF